MHHRARKPFARTFLAALLITASFTAGAANLADNGSFEDAQADNPALPAVWQRVGDGAILRMDEGQKHDGKRSIAIQRKEGTRFSGVAQGIAAAPHRGKWVTVSAWLKAENVGTGNVGIFLRADGAAGRNEQLLNTFTNPLQGSTDWVKRELKMYVSQATERIVFGVTLSAGGTLFVDSFKVKEMERTGAHTISADAQDYLLTAIANIRTRAMNAAHVDWEKETAAALDIATDAQTPAQTHDAIRHVLRALGDGHSHLILPAKAQHDATNTSTADFNLADDVLEGKGYIKVPGYSGTNPERRKAFAADIRDRIANHVEKSACGWIVDLRDNTGGSMWPMLAGLTPLLGDGTLGHFATGSGKGAWKSAGGKVSVNDAMTLSEVKPLSSPTLDKTPVAVLIGPRTASSGEGIAVAFIGRENTRSFGQPTSGLSTANMPVPLRDGAMMLVTTSVFADRTGKAYGKAIAPDQLVEPGVSGTALSEDPAVRAALQWLNAQAACKR